MMPGSLPFERRMKRFSVTLLRSRQRIKLVLGAYQRDRLRDSKPTSAVLCKKRSEYYINIQVKSEAPEQIHIDTILGVDLGITDIAVTSEGQRFGGKTIKQIKIHYASMRAVLQQKAVKGTRSSRRRCRELQQRLLGEESRYQRQINHEISKAIVTRAQEIPAKIALEDLTGVREGVNQKAGKNQRRRVNGWAFYQLKEFLTYKALQAGIPLSWLILPIQAKHATSVVSMELGTKRVSSVLPVIGPVMLISMVLGILLSWAAM
jgi:IS605 OrfB family transposase